MTAPDTKAIREKMKAFDGATPGPWSANRPREVRIVGRMHRVLNPEDYPAAFVPAWDREAIANARLIAAAPDMRETILTLCDALDELRAENKMLRGLIADAVEIIYRADNTEGTCCCGDSMLDHAEAMDCGHSPVDAGAYHAREWQKDARAALAQKGTKP